MNDKVLERDISILGSSSAFAPFAGDTILITGATGLIGSTLVKGMLRWNSTHDTPIRIIALARSEDKAIRLFGNYENEENLDVICCDISCLPPIKQDIDWVWHGASITSSAAFAAYPVEVASTELNGTRTVLDLAKTHNVKGMVYLSSLEVYGYIPQDHGEVHERDCGFLDAFETRNSYPCAKRMCECLCYLFASEYTVPVKIARLAQTFGAGVAPDDKRVFAQFAHAVVSGSPIVLHTSGESRRCYCYTTDAIEGAATILSDGNPGEAYNVANQSTYCSVVEMAEMIVGRYPQSGVKIEYDFPEDVSKFGYSKPSFINLNNDKLTSLGWKARYDLPEMYDRLIESMKYAYESQ